MAIATAAPSAALGGRGLVRLGTVKDETKQSRKQRVSASFCGSNAGARGRSSLRWGASSCIGEGTPPWLPSRPLRMHSSEHILPVVAAHPYIIHDNLKHLDPSWQGDIERSYIMIKPDGVQRGLVGEIISRFERKGFTLKGLKLFQTPQELAEEHYSELKEKPFFPKLVKYIVSGPVVAMVWEGPGIVASARKLIGVTNPLNAEPGTIRGDFGLNTGRNVIHGSDSPENGKREIELWFKEGEVVNWEPSLTPWILE